jgi:DNA-directed RNA polymerase subunit RPC12/RpoP
MTSSSKASPKFCARCGASVPPEEADRSTCHSCGAKLELVAKPVMTSRVKGDLVEVNRKSKRVE